MRTESAGYYKSNKTGTHKQNIPGKGTRIRELWDLLQANKGVILELPLTIMYPNTYISNLIDYYGLDIRNLGPMKLGKGSGRGQKGSRWILAGEWFGKDYVDYISKNQQKLKAVEKIINQETKSANNQFRS